MDDDAFFSEALTADELHNYNAGIAEAKAAADAAQSTADSAATIWALRASTAGFGIGISIMVPLQIGKLTRAVWVYLESPFPPRPA